MRSENGQFAKGNSGKPKGATSKQNKEIRERFKMLLDNNLDQIEDDLQKLNSKDRIDTIISLSAFVIPKLKATSYTPKEDKELFVDFSEDNEITKIERHIIEPDN
jgi:hypothetical protein